MSYGAIRNFDKYALAAARRRTERFNHCFPRGISLGDIDSFCEINGHFLFIEWKVGDQALNYGQSLALVRLSEQPKTTVWILWTTEDGFVTHGRRLGVHRHRVKVTENEVCERIKEWCKDSEAKRSVGRTA